MCYNKQAVYHIYDFDDCCLKVQYTVYRKVRDSLPARFPVNQNLVMRNPPQWRNGITGGP